MDADKRAFMRLQREGWQRRRLCTASIPLYMWRIKMTFGFGNNCLLNTVRDVISLSLLLQMKKGIAILDVLSA